MAYPPDFCYYLSMSEDKKTFSINKNRKAKRDRSLLPVLVVLVLVSMIGLVPIFYYTSNTFQFNSFMTDFRDSFINAQKFNGFTASYDGKEAVIDNDYGSSIFAQFSFIGRGIRCAEETPEDPFSLDFGDGSSVIMAKSSMEGRFQNTVDALYVEYTYSNGKKYRFKTDETSFDYLLKPIIDSYFSS